MIYRGENKMGGDYQHEYASTRVLSKWVCEYNEAVTKEAVIDL